ncbi:hypothetical protein JOE21_000325 [Desmospora profundinema]|uniref:DUF2642 domain-containing protein n=1 Tax=Desmospora profundinema TaxID=1571184 RepID=A0ABU1IHT6_9BACL|nr:hypothetical protein [Desmospora profundinema]
MCLFKWFCCFRNRRLRRELLKFLNQNVEITTRNGTIQGRLVRVGKDFAEVREASGNIVLIPFENFVSIRKI